MTRPVSRDDAVELDRIDPIAGFRDEFQIPDDLIYLDGNSLGPLPVQAITRLNEVLTREWGRGLVRSWNAAGWIDLAERVAGKIAPLIGARPREVMVADSTSVNLFKLLAGGLGLRPGRSTILSERENFGTDLYVAQGLQALPGGRVELRCPARDGLLEALDADVAVLMLTHVDFRSGEMHDLEALTEAAHAVGALVLWDLAHSAGAVELDLNAAGADLAVGCGYKYLNGGPGAPAFAFVARGHHDAFSSPLWGWMGHEAPFAFDREFEPASGVGRLRVGTPPILSLAALECGVDGISRIGVNRLRAKSVRLGELLIDLMSSECAGFGFELASPRDPERRGSHLSWRHPEAYAISQALISEGVVGDFRAPDLLRLGLAPAYLRFVDIWDAVAVLKGIMEEGRWDRPEYKTRSKVT